MCACVNVNLSCALVYMLVDLCVGNPILTLTIILNHTYLSLGFCGEIGNESSKKCHSSIDGREI